MTRDFAEDERGETRRSVLALFGLGVTATAGSAVGLTYLLSQDSREPQDDIDEEHYDPDDVYDEDKDEVVISPTPTYDPQSWEEALPGECELDTDERHWLVGRADRHLDIDEEGEFFDYIGEEVRLYDTGSELRMEVDEDYRGGDFRPDKGYNIPDAC